VIQVGKKTSLAVTRCCRFWPVVRAPECVFHVRSNLCACFRDDCAAHRVVSSCSNVQHQTTTHASRRSSPRRAITPQGSLTARCDRSCRSKNSRHNRRIASRPLACCKCPPTRNQGDAKGSTPIRRHAERGPAEASRHELLDAPARRATAPVRLQRVPPPSMQVPSVKREQAVKYGRSEGHGANDGARVVTTVGSSSMGPVQDHNDVLRALHVQWVTATCRQVFTL
jgi:hypothetical protein